MVEENKFNEFFGEGLRNVRHELSLTQEEFAALIDWTYEHVGRVENAVKTPPFAVKLYNLRVKAGIDLNDFFDEIHSKLQASIEKEEP